MVVGCCSAYTWSHRSSPPPRDKPSFLGGGEDLTPQLWAGDLIRKRGGGVKGQWWW